MRKDHARNPLPAVQRTGAAGALAVVLAILSPAAAAAEPETLIHSCPISTEPVVRPEPVTDREPGTIVVDADTAEMVNEGGSQLSGDVLIRRDAEFIEAEMLEFDMETGEVRSLSPARFGDPEIVVDAERIQYDTTSGTGSFSNVEFLLPSRPARGSATSLERTSRTESSLEGVMYTTCPPDDEDWTLRASSMDINEESGRGTGRNVRVAFMGVPFFYTPWIQFPIDDRRMTGVLFPEFGSSSRIGDWLQVPVYFNIAENYDATLAPLFTSRRGTRLDGEFRYLWGWGSGQVNAEYMDEDRVTGDSRYQGRLRHRSRFGGNWNATLDYRDVSDPEYLQDFSEDGRATAQAFIPSSFTLTSAGLDYGFRATLRQYQNVDPTLGSGTGPYEQWPAIEFRYTPLPLWGGLNLELDTSAVNFRKEASIEGWRQHLEPAVSLDFGNPGFRVTPRVAAAHTRYDLDDAAGTPLEIDRTVPVASLDTRWAFERTTGSGGLQLLEPRIFYLSAPFRDQADIPVFDTRRPTPTLDNLYRHNRFPGLDRYGDTEQATLGIDNSWYEPGSTRAWLSLRFAQALYFEDRLVTLPGGTPETDSTSDLFTELQYSPLEASRLRLTASWDDPEQRVNIASLQYQYSPAASTVLNLSYSFRRDITSSSNPDEPLQQAGISFAAPLGSRWQVFGKTVHSFSDDQSLENLAGFEYDSCCWNFRVFNRRYIFNREGDFNQAIWLQLTLKGMGSVGRRADEFLANDIRGYGDPR